MPNRPFIAFAIAVLLPAFAFATVILAETLEEMAARSTVVVRGRVGAQQVIWDREAGRINTFTEVRAEETLKGRVPDSFLVVQPGGVVDGVGQKAAGVATFVRDEEVLLFLEPIAGEVDVFDVRGLASGRLRIERRLSPPRVFRDHGDLAVYQGGQDGPKVRSLPPREDLGQLDVVVARIRLAIRGAK